MNNPAQLRLRITSDPANLPEVRHQVEGFCASNGIADPARGEIVLCVNEALANITRHAYAGATDRPVHLDVTLDGTLLRIRIRDWGIGRVPDDCPIVRDPLRPGGVGMVCLTQWMDSISFDPQPDGMLLTMERRVHPSPQDSPRAVGRT